MCIRDSNKGQNVRLAAKLTGWKIDIRPESGFFGEDEEVKEDEPKYIGDGLDNDEEEVELPAEEVSEEAVTEPAEESAEVEAEEASEEVPAEEPETASETNEE